MSSDNKKDLTRIEDLGEFLHEDNGTDFTDFTAEPGPSSDEPSSEFGNIDFGTTEEFPTSSEEFSGGEFTSESESFSSSSDDFPSSTEEFPSSDSFSSESSEFTSEPTAFITRPDLSEETKEDKEEKEENEESSSEIPLFSDDEPIANLEEEPLAIAAHKESPEEKTQELSFDPPTIEEPTPVYTPEPSFKQPENFEEIKKFAESTSFTGMGVEGNPSFSVLLRNVKFIEDVNDIVILLKELNLLLDGEEETRKRLTKGHLLIPRISEFAAILLTHKLRRFDIDIQMGLSDEIHPPKHHEAPETGLVSKNSLHQNQSHHFHFDHPKLEISQVIVSATPTLQGYQVIRYLGVASEHKTVPAEMVEDESNEDIPRYYQELAQKLRAHAVKHHSNAIVGLNYQLTPIPSEFGGAGHKYRLSCTGNLVWVNKL